MEENEIERPEDLRVRTVANKSKLKVSIIQAIDRKIALDELAESKGLEFGELLDEIEAIVNSGTKINIDYFLHEIMDDEHIDDILTTSRRVKAIVSKMPLRSLVWSIAKKKFV